jgi:predicted CoA-binding protein
MKLLLPNGAAPSADPIFDILTKYKRIAVVGLSSNPARPSYNVTEYMQSVGYQIVPVNPNETDVLGEPSYASLEEVPPVVDAAIQVGAKVVWMQLGIANQAAAEKARAAGITVIMDACLLIEHKRRREQLA